MQAAVETETGMMHTVTNSADIASMSRTADSQMLASVNRPAGIAEILDSIVYAAKSNNRLGVTIEHSELGKLNINLSLDKGNVHVNIHAADKGTKEIIENNIQYIIDSLEKEGVSIGGFSVGMKDYQGTMLQPLLNGDGTIKEFDDNVKNADISNGLVSVFA
jgi:flagellar hook-length control protein FliK